MDDLGFVTGLFEVEMKADASGGNFEQLVQGQGLRTELIGKVAVSQAANISTRGGAVVVEDDCHVICRPPNVELDVVDAERNRMAVAVHRGHAFHGQAALVSTDKWPHELAANII